MARPKKQEHEKRLERFNLRLTLAEIEQLREQAQASGVAPHELARKRVLGARVSPAPQRTDAALITEINRLGVELRAWGVNLNQLTRDENSGREFRGDWTALRDRLSYELDEVERVLTQVAAGYGS